MKLRTFIAASVLGAAAIAAPAASAQTAPVDGGTTIGGVAPSFLELIIAQPKTSAFASFTAAKTYSTSFDVAVTLTDDAANLSIADGEVNSGAKLGRLASGSKSLPLPLEARVGKSAFAPLNQPVDASLAKISGPLTNEKSTVNLRQQVKAKVKGSYRKVLLVTLSTETP